MRPQYGRVLPLVVLTAMSVATLTGASFADKLDGELVAWLQAFVMGSIMHVVLHRPYLNKGKHSADTKEEDSENRYVAGAYRHQVIPSIRG